jgi:DMSO/TMAO reductase YedYZ heme-binding membrane subunit
VHFVWRVKKDLSEPLAYAAILAALLLARVVSRASGAVAAASGPDA